MIDPVADPEGYAAQQQQSINTATLKSAIAIGQPLYRKFYEDYDEMEKLFVAEAQKDSALAGKMAAADNPVEFMYTEGKRLHQMQQLNSAGGIEAMIAKAREEGAKEALAKLKSNVTTEEAPTLVEVSGGGVSEQLEQLPEDIASLFD